MLDKEFLDMLVCPKCHGKLEYDPEGQALTCWACRLRYAIEDDIPILLIDEAVPVPENQIPHGENS